MSVRKADAALGLLEDILAIELLLAHDLLSIASNNPVLGAGTSAARRQVEEAIAAADPYPDSIHKALRDRFPTRG
jgi:histidine ammonia-lyase